MRTLCKFVTVMASASVIILLIVACLLWPHMPEHSMCNKDIQWGSILSHMVNLQAAVDVDLHVAIWNPNRFGVKLHELNARILYKSHVVGTGAVRDIRFRAGTVTDSLMSIEFHPSTEAWSMLRDHYHGQLLLDVLFDFDAGALIRGMDMPFARINTTYVMKDIDAEAEEQRKYCKCIDPNVD